MLGALPLHQPTGGADLRAQNGPSTDPVPPVGIHVTTSQIPPSLSVIFFLSKQTKILLKTKSPVCLKAERDVTIDFG